MKITTRGQYAMVALMDVAHHEKDGPVRLMNVQNRQKISQHYLEQLFLKMRRAGILKSVRGPGGGYMLNKPKQEITVKEILKAVKDGAVYKTHNALVEDNLSKEGSYYNHFINKYNDALNAFLETWTLSDVIEVYTKELEFSSVG